MENKHITLGEFIIENQKHFKYSSGELSKLLNSIRLAAKVVNHEVAKAGLVDILGAAGDTNIQGEDQQKLDIFANDAFIEKLFVALQVKRKMILLPFKEKQIRIETNMWY